MKLNKISFFESDIRKIKYSFYRNPYSFRSCCPTKIFALRLNSTDKKHLSCYSNTVRPLDGLLSTLHYYAFGFQFPQTDKFRILCDPTVGVVSNRRPLGLTSGHSSGKESHAVVVTTRLRVN